MGNGVILLLKNVQIIQQIVRMVFTRIRIYGSVWQIVQLQVNLQKIVQNNVEQVV